MFLYFLAEVEFFVFVSLFSKEGGGEIGVIDLTVVSLTNKVNVSHQLVELLYRSSICNESDC